MMLDSGGLQNIGENPPFLVPTHLHLNLQYLMPNSSSKNFFIQHRCNILYQKGIYIHDVGFRGATEYWIKKPFFSSNSSTSKLAVSQIKFFNQTLFHPT